MRLAAYTTLATSIVHSSHLEPISSQFVSQFSHDYLYRKLQSFHSHASRPLMQALVLSAARAGWKRCTTPVK